MNHETGKTLQRLIGEYPLQKSIRWTAVFLLLALTGAFFIFAQGAAQSSVELTAEEQDWINQNPEKLTLFFNTKFPPIEFSSESGDFVGMGADVIALVEKRLGVTFFKHPCEDWNNHLAALESGTCAIAPTIVCTAERERYAYFTTPYATVPIVIITSRAVRGDLTLDDLDGRRVAVVSGFATEKYLRDRALGRFEVVPVENVREGLRSLSFGQLDAFVENLAVAAYYIQLEGIPNLRVAGKTDYAFAWSIGVSRKYPLLYSAIQKALDEIPESELEAVRKHWIALETDSGLNPETVRLLKLSALFAALLLLSLTGITLFLKHRLNENVADLRESEGKYRRIVDTASEGIWMLGPDTMTSFVNARMTEMLDYPGEEMIGRPMTDFMFEEDKPDHLKKMENRYRGLSENYERRFRRKDGRTVWTHASATPIIDDEHRYQGSFAMLTDITDRKRAVQALRESEQKLKATVYGSPIPQYVIDRDHRVIYWNKALEELTGRKTEEMVGTDNYWSAFYRTKRPCMCDLLVDGHAGSIPEWYGAQWRKSRLVADAFEITDFLPDLGDGGKWLYCTAAPITDSQGDVIGAIETLEDVTSRIRSEMEIHQLNEELEKRVIDRTAQLQVANRELEAFSYSVSHDLRAPLRALDGFSQIILEDYASVLPKEAVSHLNRIRAGALQMGRLIDDLLRFSRLGRQSLTKQSVRPGDLVQEVWEALAVERQGREVKLSLAEMPECQADSALLRQVYYNLIANALKFTRRREKATIEIGCTLAMESSGSLESAAVGQNTYFVRDNGVGFDMQFADKLFGVFQRLHRREEYEGTGVGLAIVHRVIARHGGRIWAESEPDKGATFYLTIGDAQVSIEQDAEKAMI
jgi:PAS domain S-box-containing protein